MRDSSQQLSEMLSLDQGCLVDRGLVSACAALPNRSASQRCFYICFNPSES